MNVTELPPILSNLDLNQIFDILEYSEHYLGTFMKDELTKIKLPKDKVSMLIMNLETTKEDGSHWEAVYYDPQGKVEEDRDLPIAFDAYGTPPPEEFIMMLKANNLSHYKFNSTRLQLGMTTSCGYYCVKFLFDMKRGMQLGDFLAQFSTDFAENEKIIQKFRADLQEELNKKVLDELQAIDDDLDD